MKKTTVLLALACIQTLASGPAIAKLQPHHSTLGRLTMLAPTAFKPATEPGAGNTEIASEGVFFVHINVSPMLAAIAGGKAPSKTEVVQFFSVHGPNPDLELAEIALDGQPGVLAKTARLGSSKAQWTVIFFGAGGLQIEAQGDDALPATKQICEQIVASVKFDR